MWSVVWARKGEVKITLIDLGGRDSVQVCKDCVVSSVHYPATAPATDSIITNIIPFQNHPHQSLSIFLLSFSLFLSIFPPCLFPSIPTTPIQQIHQPLPAFPPRQILHQDAADRALQVPRRQPAHVRRHDHVGHVPQLAVWREGFGVGDVEGGAGQGAGFQGRD